MWSVPSSLPPRDERTDIFSSSVLFCVPSIFRLFCDIHKMTWNIFPFHRHRAQDAHKYFLENKNWCSVLFCVLLEILSWCSVLFCVLQNRTEQNNSTEHVLCSFIPALNSICRYIYSDISTHNIRWATRLPWWTPAWRSAVRHFENRQILSGPYSSVLLWNITISLQI